MPEDQKRPSEGPSEAVVPEAARTETYETSDVHDHLVALDSLRGIAIIAVVMTHLTSHWRTNLGPVEVLGVDALDVLRLPGVPLFFLLSGYLLTWTEGQRAKRGSYSLRAYATRRALRLIPAYYLAIVVVILLWPRKPSLADVLLHASFLHGFSPEYARRMAPAMWSLTPEVVFYFLLPLLVLKLTRPWHRISLFVGLYLISIPAQVWVTRHVDERGGAYGEPDWVSFVAGFPTTLLYLFIAGVLVRGLVERLNSRARPAWLPYAAFALFAVSVAHLKGFSILMPLLTLLPLGLTGTQVAAVVTSDLALIGFFASAVLGAPLLRGVLNLRLLSFIGLVSYSMFLLHQTVLLFFDPVLKGDWLRERATESGLAMFLAFSAFVLVFFAVTTVVSWLSFRFVESPFLKKKPK